MDANYQKAKTAEEKIKRELLIKEFMVAILAAHYTNPSIAINGVNNKYFSEDAANIAEISADVYLKRIGK